jgi:hypothetical protein
LSVNPPAQEAAALVKEWKVQRRAATQIVRAVRLYAALGRGDLRLLEDYFPGLKLSAVPRPVAVPQPAPAAAIIRQAARSEREELDDALGGLGLDGLMFGTA